MHERIEELNRHRRLESKPFRALCYAPFGQLHVHLDGTVAVCSKNVSRVVGNVLEQDLLDIWRGPAVAALRQELRALRFPPGCELCEQHLLRDNVRTNPLLDFDGLDVRGAEWPARLEFAFSDFCNLACRHCSPSVSSRLRAKVGLPPRPRLFGERLFAQLEPFLPHLREISVLGGEPLLHPEFFRLCDLLRARGLSPWLHVTTNGTVCSERVLDLLRPMNVSLAVSIDGVTRSTFERMRQGASFDHVIANVHRFRAMLGPHRQLSLNFCVTKVTWRELPDFLHFARRLDARTWVSVVTSPPRTSMLTLSNASLQRVVASLRARAAEVADLPERARVQWESVVRTLEHAANDPQRVRMQTRWSGKHRILCAPVAGVADVRG